MATSIDIRQTYQRFPGWLQPFFTWLTGKALPHQKPVVALNKWLHLGIAISLLLGGITFSFYFLNSEPMGWYVLLVVSWLFTLAGARKLAATILHQCVHRIFSGNEKIDTFIGEAVTTLMITQDAGSYHDDHFHRHHNRAIFARANDPIAQFIGEFGFRPGLDKSTYWKRLWLTCLSPIFHLKYLTARLKYNLFAVSETRRWMSRFYCLFWVSFIALSSFTFVDFILAFFVPMVILYQISALLEMLSEHAWHKNNDNNLSDRNYLAIRCWGRFCGEALPQDHLKGLQKILAWSQWTFKMVFYHFIVRTTILTGDLPQHDYHHRHPSSRSWTMAAYARQLDIDSGHQGWIPYQDIWGLFNAIEAVFDNLSKIKTPHEELLVKAHA